MVARAIGLPMMPPTETTFSCCVSRLEAVDGRARVRRLVVGDDEIDAAPFPRPFTPPDRLISFTARAAPARTWMPQGAKFAVRGVSLPILIGPC